VNYKKGLYLSYKNTLSLYIANIRFNLVLLDIFIDFYHIYFSLREQTECWAFPANFFTSGWKVSAPAAADRGALLSLTFTNDKFIHAVTWSPVPPAHCHIGVLRSSFSRLLNFGPCLEVHPLCSAPLWGETRAGLVRKAATRDLFALL